jgi:TctA family transporter
MGHCPLLTKGWTRSLPAVFRLRSAGTISIGFVGCLFGTMGVLRIGPLAGIRSSFRRLTVSMPRGLSLCWPIYEGAMYGGQPPILMNIPVESACHDRVDGHRMTWGWAGLLFSSPPGVFHGGNLTSWA